MEPWLRAALGYIPGYLEHQMRLSEQPGCAIAIAHKGKLVLEQAFGHADLELGIALTPRHRFRVASHSKSFTAAGVLKLREQKRLTLDDPVGTHVRELHPHVAAITLGQLLSHAGGLVRDGADAGQWSNRRPFLNEAELRADLSAGPVIDPNSRFKYSNHGYGLVGLAMQAITGEPYADWIAREIVAASGLHETTPDGPVKTVPMLSARGHSAKLPLGRRVVIPAESSTHALAPATGFVSTAGDLARFFASLQPCAKRSVLSVASRREMNRRQWKDEHSSLVRWYGLGTICGTLVDWDWCGHSGGYPGVITRTVSVPAHGLTVSVLTNAADGLSHGWLDGVLHILRTHATRGAPSRKAAAWGGRWWSLWGAMDLVPVDGRVLVANPALLNPMQDASEIEVAGKRDRASHGRIVLAGGYMSHGEPARLVLDARGKPSQFWLGGTCCLPEHKVAKELARARSI
ncbi:MAG: serine hydrolase domain-containing protein [Burkholderiales bacterium]